MGRERGWVAVSVRTYQSHRSQQNQPQNQRVMQQDYTVDESGATLNAVSRSADVREEERIMAQMAAASNSSQPTTSIFIRDWKVSKSPQPRWTHARACAAPRARCPRGALFMPAATPRAARRGSGRALCAWGAHQAGSPAPSPCARRRRRARARRLARR